MLFISVRARQWPISPNKITVTQFKGGLFVHFQVSFFFWIIF